MCVCVCNEWRVLSAPQEDDGATVTSTVGVLGTPAWSAPEVKDDSGEWRSNNGNLGKSN